MTFPIHPQNHEYLYFANALDHYSKKLKDIQSDEKIQQYLTAFTVQDLNKTSDFAKDLAKRLRSGDINELVNTYINNQEFICSAFTSHIEFLQESKSKINEALGTGIHLAFDKVNEEINVCYKLRDTYCKKI